MHTNTEAPRRMTARTIAAGILDRLPLNGILIGVPEYEALEVVEEAVREVLAEEAAAAPNARPPKSHGTVVTLNEVAAELAADEEADEPISPERVRQLQAVAEEKCRRSARRIAKRRGMTTEAFVRGLLSEAEPPRHGARGEP